MNFSRASTLNKSRPYKSPVQKTHTQHEKAIVSYFGECNVIQSAPDSRFSQFNPFIICFTNRSGSNTVSEDISHIPDLGQAKEMMNAQAVITTSKNRGFKTLTDYLYWVLHQQNCTNPGIKLSIDQILFLYECGILHNCFNNCHFILTRRRDILSQAISFFIAHNTKQWTVDHTPQASEPEFDEQKILNIANNISQSNARLQFFLSITEAKVHEVIYEEYISNPVQTITAIAIFLNKEAPSSNFRLEKRTQKQSSVTKKDFRKKILAKYKI